MAPLLTDPGETTFRTRALHDRVRYKIIQVSHIFFRFCCLFCCFCLFGFLFCFVVVLDLFEFGFFHHEKKFEYVVHREKSRGQSLMFHHWIFSLPPSVGS